MLRTKKLRKLKKKARSQAMKYTFIAGGITAIGVILIVAIVLFWPEGSSGNAESQKKKTKTTKTVIKKPAKKPAKKPVKAQEKKIPPPLTIDEPLPDTDIPQTATTIKGSTAPGCTLTVNGQKYEVQPDGGFAVNVELVRGINTFDMKSVSPQGLSKEKEVVINCTVTSSKQRSP